MADDSDAVAGVTEPLSRAVSDEASLLSPEGEGLAAEPTGPTPRLPPFIAQVCTEQRTEWLAHFRHSPSTFHARAIHRAVDERGLRGSTIRSVYWRLFLGLVDRTDLNRWSEQLTARRSEYDRLCAKYSFTPVVLRGTTDDELESTARVAAASRSFSIASKSEDLQSSNPLSQSSSNPWTEHFKDAELAETIRHDLTRTHADREFFVADAAQRIMFQVLFIWAKEIGTDEHGRYRQGFNEIISPLLLICLRESQWVEAWSDNMNGPAAGTDALLAQVLDREKVEHDVYAMFCAILEQISQYYVKVDTPATTKAQIAAAKKRQQHGSSSGALTPASHSPGSSTNNPHDATLLDQTPILYKCHYIYHILLSTLDPTLYAHLSAMDVAPNLFILRWYRLMLGREFHLEDTCVCWDVIFATREDTPAVSPPTDKDVAAAAATGVSTNASLHRPNAFVLTEYMCISMLLYVRQALLQGDQVFCLRRLLRYPPVEDIRVLLARAIHLKTSWQRITSDPSLTREIFDPTVVTEEERRRLESHVHDKDMAPDAPLEDGDDSPALPKRRMAVSAHAPPQPNPNAFARTATSPHSPLANGPSGVGSSAKALLSDTLGTLRSFMKNTLKSDSISSSSSSSSSSNKERHAAASTSVSHTTDRSQLSTSSFAIPKPAAKKPNYATLPANRSLPQASGVSHFLSPAGLTPSPLSTASSSNSSKSPPPVSTMSPPATATAAPTAAEYDELILLRKRLHQTEKERDAACLAIHTLQTQLKDQTEVNKHMGELMAHVISGLQAEWEATSAEATKQTTKHEARLAEENATDGDVDATMSDESKPQLEDGQISDTAALEEAAPSAETTETAETVTNDAAQETTPTPPNRPFSEDLLVQGLAELKHIKDVLVGRLTLSDMIEYLEATNLDANDMNAIDSVAVANDSIQPSSRSQLLQGITALHARQTASAAAASSAFPYNISSSGASLASKLHAPLFEPEAKPKDAVAELFELDQSDAVPGVYPSIHSATAPAPLAAEATTTRTASNKSAVVDPLLSPNRTNSNGQAVAASATTPAANTAKLAASKAQLASVSVAASPAATPKAHEILSDLLSPPSLSSSSSTSKLGRSSHVRDSLGGAANSSATLAKRARVSALFEVTPPASPNGPTAVATDGDTHSRRDSLFSSPSTTSDKSAGSGALFSLEHDDSSILLPSAKSVKTTAAAAHASAKHDRDQMSAETVVTAGQPTRNESPQNVPASSNALAATQSTTTKPAPSPAHKSLFDDDADDALATTKPKSKQPDWLLE